MENPISSTYIRSQSNSWNRFMSGSVQGLLQSVCNFLIEDLSHISRVKWSQVKPGRASVHFPLNIKLKINRIQHFLAVIILREKVNASSLRGNSRLTFVHTPVLTRRPKIDNETFLQELVEHVKHRGVCLTGFSGVSRVAGPSRAGSSRAGPLCVASQRLSPGWTTHRIPFRKKRTLDYIFKFTAISTLLLFSCPLLFDAKLLVNGEEL